MVKSKQRGFSPCNVPGGFTDLGPQIVTDILSRLPIESILRCRSVCKNWYSLIKDPEFIILHLCRTYNQPYRFIVKEIWSDTSDTFLLDLEECKAREIFRNNLWSHELRIMCSCNGLLCIALTVAYNPVYICNPFTRESIMLPLSKSKPSKCTVVGLGVDTSSGKYKAVRTYEADDDGGIGFDLEKVHGEK